MGNICHWGNEICQWLSSEESARSAGDSSLFLGWEDPLEEGMATPVFLPGKSRGQRSLAGYSPCGRKRVGHNLETKQKH